MAYRIAMGVLWTAWLASWWAAARWSAPVRARAPQRVQRQYHVLLIAGALLLFLSFAVLRQTAVFYEVPPAFGWPLVGVQALGLGLTWWARLHLGRLWSASVTRKEGHRVVETGPYARVRHPIYTGLLLALLASALVKGSALAFAALGLFAVSFVIKARLEERFLREELGPEYDAYAARVPMLVPFWCW